MIDDVCDIIVEMRDRIEALYPYGDPQRSTMMRCVNASEDQHILNAHAILTLVRLELEREEKRIRDAAEEDAYWTQRETEEANA